MFNLQKEFETKMFALIHERQQWLEWLNWLDNFNSPSQEPNLEEVNGDFFW